MHVRMFLFSVRSAVSDNPPPHTYTRTHTHFLVRSGSWHSPGLHRTSLNFFLLSGFQFLYLDLLSSFVSALLLLEQIFQLFFWVKMFNDAVHVQYIYKAGKPGRAGYENAMKQLKTDVSTTLFVGDQLFTDVWGARNTGIHSILVQPIDKKEEIQIILKRYLEKIVLASYRRYCKKNNKVYLTE